MYFSTLFALVAISTAPAVFGQVGTHCGTTEDATYSDCQALVDPATWSSAWAGSSNVCHYSNPDDIFGAPATAYNTACHGNCCVYFASKTGGMPDEEQTRQDAMGLFGCADMAVNKINAMVFKEQAYGVCISDGNGCGDCFDDKDFSGGCANC
ncbi:hypothetical protein B0H13DRAFT_1886777 [Mycena leptocephala]|nr:hypothetical protein B0H13DRAFT_2235670 [Mycena leptocephala]KAJ7892434.1 hypothetical protein B0H13DRAFT_1886777 [Mycena leptocephala]